MMLWQISLLLVNIRPQLHSYFIDYYFSLIKEKPLSPAALTGDGDFIYFAARNQIKKITF